MTIIIDSKTISFQNNTLFIIMQIPGDWVLWIYDTTGVLICSQAVVLSTDVMFRKDDLDMGIYFFAGIVIGKGPITFS